MNLTSAILISISILNGYFCQIQEEWRQSQITNQIEFLDYLNSTEMKVVIFFNSTSCHKCGDLLPDIRKKIEQIDIIIVNKIDVILVNTNLIAQLNSSFDFPDKVSVIFYFRSDSFILPDFNRHFRQLMNGELSEGDFLYIIKDFVVLNLNSYCESLGTIEVLDSILEFKKMIVLYIGEDNYDFEIYIRFAYTHPDSHFYYIHNKEIGKMFFEKYNFKENFEDSNFYILRHSSILDEFEGNFYSVFRGVRNFMLAKRFLDFELYPKLRKPEDFENIVFNLFSQHEKILLYIGGDDFMTSQSFSEYKNAIKLLPKRMIYSYSSPRVISFSYIMNLFSFVQVTVGVDNVYLLHLIKDDQIEVLTMKKTLTKENIIAFVFEFFEKNKGLILDPSFIDLDIIKRNKP